MAGYNFGPSIGLGPKTGRDSRRGFTRTQEKEIWAQQNGKCGGTACHHCKLDPRTTEYHHIKGWADKGKTIVKNGKALCANCHTLEGHHSRLKKTDKKRKSRSSMSDMLKPPQNWNRW